MKFPHIRKIEPQELADFLNAKGGNSETFKCPICKQEHQSLIDNMPIDDKANEAKQPYMVLQSVLPAFIYPEALRMKQEIENNAYPESYTQFTNGMTLGLMNQVSYREVLHLVCDNCGYIRTFSKDKILQWLVDEGRFYNE